MKPKLLVLYLLCAFVLNKTGFSQTVINSYAKVEMICGDAVLTVKDISGFGKGDSVLIIQMQGAIVQTDTTATVPFGRVLDYRSAGLYELNEIAAVEGNKIHLLYKLKNNYQIDGQVQLVSFPNLDNGLIDSLTCAPWDGETGGVLAFSGGILKLTGNLDVSGKGFRGGRVSYVLENRPCTPLDDQSLFSPSDSFALAGNKGEGVAILPVQYQRGPGFFSNGGGGGNNHNHGGGGGANGGTGGIGGYYDPCVASIRTMGGDPIPLQTGFGRAFLGGGGGAGHANEGIGTDGGNGGGIIIIKAVEIDSKGYSIMANGADAESLPFPSHDGGGGGGAGGTIICHIEVNTISELNLIANGGKGSNVETTSGGGSHGPGGGGSGGLVNFVNDVNNTVKVSVAGGLNGYSVSNTGQASDQDATSGDNGGTSQNLQLSYSIELCQPIYFDTLRTLPTCDSTTDVKVIATSCLTDAILYAFDSSQFQIESILQKVPTGQRVVLADDGCWVVSDSVEITNYLPLALNALETIPFVCDSFGTIWAEYEGGKSPVRAKIKGKRSGIEWDWQNNGLFENIFPDTFELTIMDARQCSIIVNIPMENESITIPVSITTIDSCARTGIPFSMLAIADSTRDAKYSYTWSPTFALDSAYISSPTLVEPQAARYTVIVRDNFGCQGDTSIDICISSIPFYIPNVIRPKDSNIQNQYFTIWGGNDIKEISSMQIYDRWGNLVFKRENFQANDPPVGWSGTIESGKPVFGVFAYFLQLSMGNNTVVNERGTVTVIR